MAIPKDKSRIIITLPEKMKSDIEFLSYMDKRTPSKEIEFLIEQYFEQIENRFSPDEYNTYYEETYKPKQLAERIVMWLTSTTHPNHKTSSFQQVFKGENITEKVIDLISFNKKISESRMALLMECIKTLNNNTVQKD